MLGASGYTTPCPDNTSYCGVFQVPASDQSVARSYGECIGPDTCLALAKHLPGGFDCYDSNGKLVKP